MAIDYTDIGQRIKQQRVKKGLTQEKLAETTLGVRILYGLALDCARYWMLCPQTSININIIIL